MTERRKKKVKCQNHGVLVNLFQGKIYCRECGEQIPVDKLKKK